MHITPVFLNDFTHKTTEYVKNSSLYAFIAPHLPSLPSHLTSLPSHLTFKNVSIVVLGSSALFFVVFALYRHFIRAKAPEIPLEGVKAPRISPEEVKAPEIPLEGVKASEILPDQIFSNIEQWKAFYSNQKNFEQHAFLYYSQTALEKFPTKMIIDPSNKHSLIVFKVSLDFKDKKGAIESSVLGCVVFSLHQKTPPVWRYNINCPKKEKLLNGAGLHIWNRPCVPVTGYVSDADLNPTQKLFMDLYNGVPASFPCGEGQLTVSI